MPKELLKKIALRYEFLFFLLALFFIAVLVITKTDAGLVVNIIATLLMLALIPVLIIIMLDRRAKRR
jgi:hypothetical protein